jgi:hypothetical protein
VNACRACQHLLENHAKGPDVRSPVGRHPTRLLRRHVGSSTQDHRGVCPRQPQGRGVVHRTLRRRILQDLGQAEVQDLYHTYHTVGSDLDVGALQVAVDDAAFGKGRTYTSYGPLSSDVYARNLPSGENWPLLSLNSVWR